MRQKLTLVLAALLILAATAHGTPYWIAWEGDDIPENEGWLWVWGFENGPQQGGAARTLATGIMTLDGLGSDQIWDGYELLGDPSPDPGETFRTERRVLIDATGDPFDVSASARYAPPGDAPLDFSASGLRLNSDEVLIDLEPGVFHDCILTSPDMRSDIPLIHGSIQYPSFFEPE
ncbi:MAG: hypothetical protein RBU21_25660 [FCB group bacterium]|jgi:hypothetical protein|nr:hypothetical protein [FCB group bacterium]